MGYSKNLRIKKANTLIMKPHHRMVCTVRPYEPYDIIVYYLIFLLGYTVFVLFVIYGICVNVIR
jgi:hypothetical protein